MDYESIKRLDKELNEVGLFTPVSKTKKDKDGETTWVYRERSAVLWNIKNDKGEYDDQETLKLVQLNFDRKANLMFQKAKAFIEAKNKEEEVFEKGPFPSIDNLTSDQKVFWSWWVLYHFEAQDIRPVEEYEEIVDGQGDLIGMKKLPKDEKDYDLPEVE